MEIVLAATAGFCSGVLKAVQAVENALQESSSVYMLGSVIHNDQEMDRLMQRGAKLAEKPSDIPPDASAVIRSHGVPPDVYAALQDAVIVDATCPFVRRLQMLARDYAKKGLPVIIFGEKFHPEVQAVRAYAEINYVVHDATEAAALPDMPRALLIAQTTQNREEFRRVETCLKEKIADLVSEDTICSATGDRQEEARRIARQVDAMLIIGGKDSSNTRRLAEICADIVPSLHIETARDISPSFLRGKKRLGITAGASTPAFIIKEVLTLMNDFEKNGTMNEEAVQAENSAETQNALGQIAPEQSAPPETVESKAPVVEENQDSEENAEETFAAAFEKTMVSIRSGQTVTGTIVQIGDDEICVNIGYKSDGIVKRSDLVTDKDLQVGDAIEVEVVKVNDGDGNVILSQRNIVNRKNWDELMAKYEAGEPVEGVGKETVKGGLIAFVNGIRAFIPASQLSRHYVEKIEEFVGKPMRLKIIEADRKKKRIVASRKAVLVEEEGSRKKKIWDVLEEGQIIKGVVQRLTDFGAFVDIGGVDGLVHVTDLSWGRVKHPSDVVSVHQEIEVKVLALDRDRERISLGYKQLQPHPWDVVAEKYPEGAIVTGKVVRLVTFGAFVELESGLDGLVHISQCAPRRVNKVEDAVNVGDFVRVKILDVNPKDKRISLSIRQALEEEDFDVPMADAVESADAFQDDFAEEPEPVMETSEIEVDEVETPAEETEE